MITCPKCGHENEESAVKCADCRNNLRRAHGNPTVEEKAADELGEVLNQLDLPVMDDETATGEPLDGEALFHLLMHPRATAAEIAALDVEALTKKVAYRRKRKVAPGAVDPALTNAQIAEAILDYVRSAPPDTLAGQVARATFGEALLHETGEERRSIRRCVYVLWAGIGIAGIMAGYVLGYDTPYCQSDYEGEMWTYVTFFSLPVIWGVGMVFGAGVGWLAHRRLRQVVHHYVAILMATVCIAIIGPVLGYAMVATSCLLLHRG